MIYLDTSALVKLLAVEPQTQALWQWLESRREELVVSSSLAQVEVMQAARQADEPGLVEHAQLLLEGLDTVALTEEVLSAAADAGPSLGPAQALHLASALAVRGELGTVVTYDEALQRACEDAGLAVEVPMGSGEVRHPSVDVDALRAIKSDPGKYFEGRRPATFNFTPGEDNR